MKKVCQWENLGVDAAGDCDGDGAIDPGEMWQVTPPVVSFQTEEMFGVTARLETTNPDVIILKEVADIGDVVPFLGVIGTIGNGVRIYSQLTGQPVLTAGLTLDGINIKIRGVAMTSSAAGRFVLACAGTRGLRVIQWSDIP